MERCLGVKLNPRSKEWLNAQAGLVEFPKGHHPVRQGEQMEAFYFLIRGLVRGYYVDEDGREITKCFSQENQFFSSECFRTGTNASFSVECLESCRCIRIPYSSVRSLDELGRTMNRLYQDELARLDNRVKNLLSMSARERYLEFCREYPGLQERVPLKYIASYIGIQAGSISRIRKEIKNSPKNEQM